MKAHIAVVAWDNAGVITKFMDYDSAAEAAAHISRVNANCPLAFATTAPVGLPASWRVSNGSLVSAAAAAAEIEDAARRAGIVWQIAALERTATPRRLRDAMHPGQKGQDGKDWLVALEAQIAALRMQWPTGDDK
tara:strand:+ start:77 stop:481 length:405 start_codon:yes stop_codon:yes gene_type:complete